MTPALDAMPIPGSPVVPGHRQTIAVWNQIHRFSPEETARLESVLKDYPPADVARELDEELRCVLAARKLAEMPPLTKEIVDRARAAFESGRVPFVPQDVD